MATMMPPPTDTQGEPRHQLLCPICSAADVSRLVTNQDGWITAHCTCPAGHDYQVEWGATF